MGKAPALSIISTGRPDAKPSLVAILSSDPGRTCPYVLTCNSLHRALLRFAATSGTIFKLNGEREAAELARRSGAEGKERSDWQLELRTLRYFVCVAEEGALTRAAERLRIAQPALSRQIAKLEADLGVSVFVRTPRGVELTEAGEILLSRSNTILAQIQQTHHDVTAHASNPRGVVVLGMPPTPGEFIAPPPRPYPTPLYDPHLRRDCCRDGAGYSGGRSNPRASDRLDPLHCNAC